MTLAGKGTEILWVLLLVLIAGAFAGATVLFHKSTAPSAPSHHDLDLAVVIAPLLAGAAAAICVVDAWTPIRGVISAGVSGTAIAEAVTVTVAGRVLLHGGLLLGLAIVIRSLVAIGSARETS